MTFHEFQQTKIIKIIEELPKNKASTFKDIPVTIMVNSVHIYSHALTSILNDYVKNGNFPDVRKYGDITPVFKKVIRQIKVANGLLVSLLISQKCLKN